MPGIDLTYMCHELNINPTYLVVKQKPQCFSPKKNKAINDEVDRMLEIGEYKYPDWIIQISRLDIKSNSSKEEE